MNVPPSIAAVLARDLSMAGPLSSTLSVEDLWDILEVMQVEAENQRLIDKAAEKQ